MRIRRSLTTTATSSAAAALTSSDPDHNNHNLRCSNTTITSIIVCVLNQSPWDVADLSSCQLDGGLFSLTGTTPVPQLAIGSQSLGPFVKLCGRETKAAASGKSSGRGENSAGMSPREVKIRAEKSSTGKPQIRTASVKKQQREWNDSNPKPVIKRSGRPAKRLCAANPSEFYYYSGFGPQWGKKRETLTKPPVVVAPSKTVVVSDQELHKDEEGSAERDIEFVEYDEDDEDDGDENEEGTRRSRGRKRVKARSLKSLM